MWRFIRAIFPCFAVWVTAVSAHAQSCPLGEPASALCETPRLIPGTPGQHVVVMDAAAGGPAEMLCDTDAGNVVWFEFSPTVDGFVSISTCHPATSYDTVIEVWRGGNEVCSGTPSIACNNDRFEADCNNGCAGSGSRVNFAAATGERIRFAIGAAGQNPAGCPLCLGVIVTIGTPCGDPPMNLDCSSARALPGTPGSQEARIDVQSAIVLPTEPQPSCATLPLGNTVWFSMTPTVSGPLTFSTCHPNTTYDTVVQAWTGTCGGALIPVRCNDDDKGNPACDNACGRERGSTVSFAANAGQTYYFQVGSFDNNAQGCALCLGVRTTLIDPCLSDVTPPRAELTAPTELGCACGTLLIRGTATDPESRLASYTLETRPAGRPGNWTLIRSSAAPVIDGTLGAWETARLSEGYHFLRLTARNICGQTRTAVTVVWVGTEFDTVRLDRPEEDEVVGGRVCFDGTVADNVCFDSFGVEVQPDGGVFGPVTTVDNAAPKFNEVFATWETGATVSDGDYRVRIDGVDGCGQSRTQFVGFVVDNTPPTAVITDPAPCGAADETVTIRGTAGDANLAQWSLQYTGGDETGWVTISSGNTPVVEGILAEWDTSGLRPCAYTIRLVVTDRSTIDCGATVGQRAEYLTSVRVGRCGDCDGDGDIDLSDFVTFQGNFTGPQ